MIKCKKCGYTGSILSFTISKDDWDFYKCAKCKARQPIRKGNNAPMHCETQMNLCQQYEGDVIKCPEKNCGNIMLVDYTIYDTAPQ